MQVNRREFLYILGCLFFPEKLLYAQEHLFEEYEAKITSQLEQTALLEQLLLDFRAHPSHKRLDKVVQQSVIAIPIPPLFTGDDKKKFNKVYYRIGVANERLKTAHLSIDRKKYLESHLDEVLYKFDNPIFLKKFVHSLRTDYEQGGVITKEGGVIVVPDKTDAELLSRLNQFLAGDRSVITQFYDDVVLAESEYNPDLLTKELEHAIRDRITESWKVMFASDVPESEKEKEKNSWRTLITQKAINNTYHMNIYEFNDEKYVVHWHAHVDGTPPSRTDIRFSWFMPRVILSLKKKNATLYVFAFGKELSRKVYAWD
jgi:proteasome lid subunit RPN8/RPN11